MASKLVVPVIPTEFPEHLLPVHALPQKYLKESNDIFWIFSGEFALLDNFAPTSIWYGGLRYPTTEHAFAAMKSNYPSIQAKIRKTPSPGSAKGMGRQVKLREDWDEVKFGFMWEILQAKFFDPSHPYHENLIRLLVSTKGRMIWEGNSWNDKIWGVTANPNGTWSGQNALGVMLMMIRRIVLEGRMPNIFPYGGKAPNYVHCDY